MSYDNWLEAPYRERAANDERFERWADAEDEDIESADAYERFEADMESDYEDHLLAQAENAADMAFEDSFYD